MTRCLIVGDQEQNRYFLDVLLREHGYETITAENGRDALNKSLLTPPDLIVSDILMPVMDGFTLCRQCKSDNTLKHIPFVFYTANYIEPKYEKFALDLGADRFILKPQKPEILINILIDLLAEKKPLNPAPAKPLGEEMEFFRRHNEILFSKLEQKMSELKESEDRYRFLLRNTSDYVARYSLTGILLYVSDAMYPMIGYKPEEVAGTSGFDRVHPDDRPRVQAALKEAIEKGMDHKVEYRAICKDGSQKWVEMSAKIVHNDQIGQDEVVAVVRDIDERKCAEQELRKSEQRLCKLADNLFNVVVYQLTAEPGGGRRFTYISRAVERLNEVTEEEVLADAGVIYEQVLPKYRSLVREREEEALKNLTNMRVEVQSRLPSGRLRWFEYASTPRYQTDGLLVWDGVEVDITERKQAEEALQDAERRFLQVTENTGEWIWEVDTAGIYQYCSPAVERILGYKPDELVGKKHFYDFFAPDVREAVKEGAFAQFSLKVPFRNFVNQNLHKNGEIVILETSGTPILDAKGNLLGYRGADTDITERKLNEARLESLLSIAQHKFKTTQDLLDFALEDAIRLTGSKIGYIYFYNDEKKEFRLNTWSKEVMRQGSITEPQTIYHLDATGIWGEAVRQAKPIVVNDFQAPHPLKKGYPEGHAPLYKYLMVPVSSNGRIVAVTGVANKQADYDESDVRQLTLLMDSVWRIAEQKKSEEALSQAEEKYRSIFENAQEGIYRSTTEGRIIMANQAMAKMFGYDSPEELMNTVTDAAHQLYVDPEERTKIKEMIESHGFVRNYETQYYRKDGCAFWVSMTMKAIRDADGSILYYEGIDEDITERRQSFDRLRKTLGAAVQAIASVVEIRGPYTAGHQRRVADLARAIATDMGLSPDRIDGLRVAGTIHDLGKISVPAEILSMPRKLTDLEYGLIKTHVQSGYDILKDIEFPWPIARMILEHHERMDGSGYPNGLTGDHLLLESRILAVADVVESMASHRPYRPEKGLDAAWVEIGKHKRILYDPEVVAACLRLFNEKGYKLVD